MQNTEPSTINCFSALCNVKLNELIMVVLNIEQVRDRGSTQHTVSLTQHSGTMRAQTPWFSEATSGPMEGGARGGAPESLDGLVL